MPCFAYGCNSGYNGKSFRSFRPGKDVGETWISILNKTRRDKSFSLSNKNHVLCEKHFNVNNIIKCDSFVIDGEKVDLPRNNWKLKPGTLPTIFPSLPSYRQIKSPVKRKCPTSRSTIPTSVKKKRMTIEPDSVGPALSRDTVSQSISLLDIESVVKSTPGWIVTENDGNRGKSYQILLIDYEENAKIAKNVLIDETGKITIYFGGTNVTSRFPLPITRKFPALQDFVQLFFKVKEFNLCQGLQGYDKIKQHQAGILKDGIWYSISCETVIALTKVCKNCKKLSISFLRILHASKSRTKKTPKKKCRAPQQKVSNRLKSLKAKIANLRRKTLELRRSLKMINKETVWQSLEKQRNLPKELRLTIFHAAKLAQCKSAKGMRYTTDWLLECLLLRIKSPSAYVHLRCAKILPLPHVRTLQKLIRGLPCEFGFNSVALNAIKSNVTGKPRRDRQMSLIFDEIQLRESLDFNKIKLKFDGFIDYANYSEELIADNERGKLADHALVILCRPVNGNWTQPIAAFATSGAAKGNAIAKVIIAAILKLEDFGAEILTVICDGAKTNKSFWKGLGISGKCGAIKNFISNPFCNTRKIFFTCDVPHVFKCIRNHYMKYKKLLFKGQEIDYSYYEKVFTLEDERIDGNRMCPKLTFSHICPNNFEKMNVSLCTQLFSRTVATSLGTLRKMKHVDFKNSEHTEEFTLTLNNLFDCLNTQREQDCINLGPLQRKKIFEFLEEINSSKNIDTKSRTKHDRNRNTFASTETMAALRVTLKSVLDMMDYLKSELNYSYVLTSKFTQDCLEKFFGLIRAAGGREDHPTVGTFLQLFRLLSFYTPCKRILRGNVKHEDRDSVLVEFSTSLRNASKDFQCDQKAKITSIEQMLTAKLMQEGISNEAVQNVDQNVINSTIESNIVYQMCGYLVHKSVKLLKCNECRCSLQSNESLGGNEDILYNMKKTLNGNFKRPTIQLYKLIRFSVEPPLSTLLKEKQFYGDIFLDIVKNISPIDIRGIGCTVEDHSTDVVVKIVSYYIVMRLNFYCRSFRNTLGHGKATKNLRKRSKLFST